MVVIFLNGDVCCRCLFHLSFPGFFCAHTFADSHHVFDPSSAFAWLSDCNTSLPVRIAGAYGYTFADLFLFLIPHGYGFLLDWAKGGGGGRAKGSGGGPASRSLAGRGCGLWW